MAFQPREDPGDAAGARHAAMRNGDARTHARAAQLFAFQQGFENALFRQARLQRGARRQFLQKLLLVLRFQRGNDSVRGKQVGNIHLEIR